MQIRFIKGNKCKRKQNKQSNRLKEQINGTRLSTPTDKLDKKTQETRGFIYTTWQGTGVNNESLRN